MRCALSSRGVNSTESSFFVVTLPSTVMAKVTATNGSRMWERPRRGLKDRGTEAPPMFLLGTTDFMLKRRYFCFHFTHAQVTCLTARFVEEVNDAARRAAEKDDEEAHRPDEFCYRNGNA